METCVRCGKESPIIPEQIPVCHDCRTPGEVARKRTGQITARSPFPRPPRIAERACCRGCFNRCELTAGEPGVCTVKQNIAGKITRCPLRIKAIAVHP